MNWLKRSSYITTLAGLLAVGMAIDSSALGQAQQTFSSLRSNLPTQLNFEPPSGLGYPQGREGGATRSDDCIPDKNQKLTVLIPSSLEAKTAAEYPAFFWYLPPTKAQKMEFYLLDENQQEMYRTTLAIAPNQTGIMSLQIPASKSLPLKVGRKYSWKLGLICSVKDPSKNVIVEDLWLQRVEPGASLSDKIDTEPLEKRLAIYAKSGLWHETVATLAELRRLHPNDPDLQNDWAKVLNSVGLNEIAGKPMVVQSAAAQVKTELTQDSPKRPFTSRASSEQ